MFHVMKTEEELKIAFAPKEVDGRLLQVGEADLLSEEQKLSSAVDVVDAQHFIAAGFDVNFVGPEDVLPPGAAHTHDASKDETPGEQVLGVAEGACEALGVGEDRVDEQAYVDEDAFCSWLENAEFAVVTTQIREKHFERFASFAEMPRALFAEMLPLISSLEDDGMIEVPSNIAEVMQLNKDLLAETEEVKQQQDRRRQAMLPYFVMMGKERAQHKRR